MGFQEGFNLAVGALGVGGMFVLKMIFERIAQADTAASDAANDLSAYKLHVAESFLSVRRFEGFEERLFAELKAIKDSLADKADRE